MCCWQRQKREESFVSFYSWEGRQVLATAPPAPVPPSSWFPMSVSPNLSPSPSPASSPRLGVTLDDLQVSPSMGMDDVELISSDDDDGGDFMKNLCKEAEYAHEQLKSEYEGIGSTAGANGDGARRGSLQWTDKMRLAEVQSADLGMAANVSTKAMSSSSDISTDTYSSGGDYPSSTDTHPLIDADLFMDEHNQGYAAYLKDKQLEDTLSPQEKAARQALQQQESESRYVAEFQQRSQYNLYAGFNGTPGGEQFLGNKEPSPNVSVKKVSAPISRLNSLEKMADRKKKERKEGESGGGGFWCCGGR